MAQSVQPFLMFEGQAEAAMRFYLSLIPGSEILDITRYGPGEAGDEGSVNRASFRLKDQVVLCIDSPVHHAFTFTPSFSFFVECESEAEILRLSQALGEDREPFMPLADYGFGRKFTWIADRYGVAWQLNLK
jgi:predicted 3-demethylubiquinone-9 3-methyltransferase (glyoxalase superfamily)